jgi:subtilisin family serine protease
VEDKQGKSLPGSYIVVYKNAVTFEALQEDIKAAPHKDQIVHTFQHVFRGYAAKLTSEQVQAVRGNPNVQYVEVDQEMRAVQSCTVPVEAGSWGLTRVNERQMSLDGEYSYPSSAGNGITAYIIDTGIYVANEDFAGRATFGFKAESSWSNTDANGHGTHVASTVVGKKYGVARKASAIAVKVLGDNGSGSNAGVIAGVDWAVNDHVTKKKRSVINMSLGGGYSAALNAAVEAAVDAGIFTAVAAGNENRDACIGSPSSAPKVLTVGSTDIGVNSKDVRSYFSNFGKCVDIFAPGSDITAAWIGGTKAVNTISGTSMASPHVAGIGALYLSENPSASGKDIQDEVVSAATGEEIDLMCSSSACLASPNLMGFNGCNRNGRV